MIERVITAVISRLTTPPDHDWHWIETSRGPMMRRRLHGKLETRPMTETEMQDYMGSRAGW